MLTFTTAEAENAVQKLMVQADLLLLMTGPDGLRNIDDDQQYRLLGYCLSLGVNAVRLLAPDRPEEESRVCSGRGTGRGACTRRSTLHHTRSVDRKAAPAGRLSHWRCSSRTFHTSAAYGGAPLSEIELPSDSVPRSGY